MKPCPEVINHVIDILLRHALVAGGATCQRRSCYVIHRPERRPVACGFHVVLKRDVARLDEIISLAVAHAEKTSHPKPVIRPGSMQKHHKRIGFRFIKILRDIDRVWLVSVIYR